MKECTPGGQRIVENAELVVAPLSVRTNFYWNFAGNVIYAVCQWGIIIVIAKLTSAEKLGHFALGLAVTAPIVMFFNMQLRVVQATDVKEGYAFKEYLGHRLVSMSLAILIITIFSIVTIRTAVLITMAVGIAKGIESISDIIYGYFQHREQMDRIAQSMIIKGVVSLVILGIIVWISKSVLLGVVSLCISWLLTLFLLDIQNLRKITTNRDQSFIKPSFQLSIIRNISIRVLPLGLASLIMSVNTNIPRYLLDSYLGRSQLGVFAALAYPIVAGSMVIMAFGQALTPRLAKLFLERNMDEYRSVFHRMFIASLALALGGLVFVLVLGEVFLKIAYTSEYSNYSQEFVIMMIGGGISYLCYILGYALTAAQCFNIQTISFSINLILTFSFGLAFIPKHGLMGAAYAILIGTAGQAILEGIKLVSITKSRKAIS